MHAASLIVQGKGVCPEVSYVLNVLKKQDTYKLLEDFAKPYLHKL